MSANSQHRGTIVGIGDFLVDIWWRVSPAARNVEHAAMALCSSSTACQIRPGGAGLLMDVIGRLGFAGCLFSIADNKPDTQVALQRLAKYIDTSTVVHNNSFCTPVKTRYVNENGHILMRHDVEEIEATKQIQPLKLADLVAQIKTAVAVVVSDYAKNGIPADVRKDIVPAAKLCGVPIFVDAKPHLLIDYRGADLIKINSVEFEKFAAQYINVGALSIQDKLIATARELQTPALIVTCGSRGVWYVLQQKQSVFIKAPKTYKSGNCVGAGDVFLAGLLLGFFSQRGFNPPNTAPADFERALNFGFAAAALRVRSSSTKAITAQQVFKEIARSNRRIGYAAIADVLSFVKTQRAAGHKIVFTNGCFDLLHSGHRSLLQQSRKLGDVLIVAVDSDANVRRNKGLNRPIQGQNTRAENVAALVGVSAVCVFDDTAISGHNTLLELIGAIQPDVLVKGDEYTGKSIVGAESVLTQDVPGRVVLVPMVPNTSTTALVTKMKA
jgi:D-beta-D-heptose 7-phosphate kinase/D-beta-D-heptose 1-phosphate adenosyltransferase